MNCPFCDYELQEHRGNLSCPLCKKILPREIWEILIDGQKSRKMLEFAMGRLDDIANTECMNCYSEDVAFETLTEIRLFLAKKE